MIGLLKKTAEVLSVYAGKKLAVGVSGGRDSMCLLHAILHCGAVKREDITVVHVNHCLRGLDADGDENFVCRYCELNDVRFVAKRVDVTGYASANGLTIEQAARDLRYTVFFDLVERGEADVVLTAHHALDNAESVLMHLFRGAGLDGLRGMSDGRIARPFIDVYPDELDEYVKSNGIEYVTDGTNFCDDADRNFIRINVIPLIEQRYRGVVRAVNALSSECDTVCDYLDGALDPSYITRDGGATLIDERALTGALASRYVRRAMGDFSLTDITREQTERVVKLVRMRTGATVELSNGICAAREYGCVSLFLDRPRYDGETPVRLGANFIDGLAVDIEKLDLDPRRAAGRCVDLDALCGATLRFRRDGDMFTPFGGKRRKLKQYFIDNKVPKRRRDRIPLLCRGSEVLVIVGIQISDDAKISPDTVNKGAVTPRWL